MPLNRHSSPWTLKVFSFEGMRYAVVILCLAGALLPLNSAAAQDVGWRDPIRLQTVFELAFGTPTPTPTPTPSISVFEITCCKEPVPFSFEDVLSRLKLRCLDKWGSDYNSEACDSDVETICFGWVHRQDSGAPWSSFVKGNRDNCTVTWEIWHSLDPGLGFFSYNGIGCVITF
ncbi:MAG: hypothetical protein RL417_1227 [Pseudomonadota bacterium]